MGNIRKDRRAHRWPRAVVPYRFGTGFDPSWGNLVRQAMDDWAKVTPVTFVEATGEPDFLSFEWSKGRCFSHIGRQGGKQIVGCEYKMSPVVAAGAELSFAVQGGVQTVCMFAGTDGAVWVMWAERRADPEWAYPVALTRPGTVIPGARIALHHQNGPDQLNALFVDVNGAINVMWTLGTGEWEGPAKLTPDGTAPAGAPIALHYQGGPNQLNAVFVDTEGRIN